MIDELESKTKRQQAIEAVDLLRELYERQGHYIFRACADELCGIYTIDNPDKGAPFRVKIATVLRIVCRYFAVSQDTLRKHSHKGEYSECRHVFVYLCRKMTLASTPQIGSFLNRDHSTIVYAEHKMKDRFEKDADFRKTIAFLENTIIDFTEQERRLGIINAELALERKLDNGKKIPVVPADPVTEKKKSFDPAPWKPPAIKPNVNKVGVSQSK